MDPGEIGMPQQPAIGQDVTALMPPIGADVSHLMTASAEPQPPSPAVGMAASAAPSVGGIVGGMTGGVPGAVIGGAAGEGYGQLIKHATELPGAVADVARNVVAHPVETARGAYEGMKQGAEDAGIAGAVQGAGQLIGTGLVKGASAVAPWLMSQAASPAAALAREFPDLSQTMLDNALTVTGGGLAKARQLLGAAKATANAALDTAHAAGASVPIADVTGGLSKTLDVVMNSSDIPGGLAKLAKLESKIQAGRAGTLTMREADALKTSLQAEAKNLYKSVAAGNGSRGMALEMVAKADMAQALNAAIDKAATDAGAAGYKAANSSAQDLIGATRAISRQLLGTPTKTTEALANVGTLGLNTAAGKSSIALALQHPVVQGLLRALPKPALAAIASALYGGSNP